MTNHRYLRGVKTAFVLALVVAALAACRQQEQGRVLMYEKGTYLGTHEPALSADIRAALDRRALRQGGQ